MNAMHKCPYPGCNYVAETITTYHYENVHGQTKQEVIQAHGKPEILVINPDAIKKKYANRPYKGYY